MNSLDPRFKENERENIFETSPLFDSRCSDVIFTFRKPSSQNRFVVKPKLNDVIDLIRFDLRKTKKDLIT